MSDVLEEEDYTTKVNTRRHAHVPVGPPLLALGGRSFIVLIGTTSVLDSYFTYLGKLIVDDAIGPVTHLCSPVCCFVMGGWQCCRLSQYVASSCWRASLVSASSMTCGASCSGISELSFSYFDRAPVGWIMSRVTSDSERIAELRHLGARGYHVGYPEHHRIDHLHGIDQLAPQRSGVWCHPTSRWVLPSGSDNASCSSTVRFADSTRSSRGRTTRTSRACGSSRRWFARSATRRSLGRRRARCTVLRTALPWFSALFLPIVQIIGALGTGVVVWYGGLRVESGGMTVGGIQAFLSYLAFIMWPIQDMARVYAEMQRSVASAERVFSLIDAKPDVVDREGAMEVDRLKGEVAFENVGFRYKDGDAVLDGFNLHVQPGEHIALVGPTGGGKSTIVNLVCRFYEPTEGTIRIDGVDYTRYTQHALQSRVGMVLQTPHLFSGTIRENIRYGRLDATDAEVEAAAILAHAHDFVSSMEHGYDEEVGEGGNLLSVGQKQLVSIARAMLAAPDILILDEATSSVDTLTEVLIQKGMEAVMAGRTSFVIAHRLSTIRRADRILVIQGGRIAEMGTHEELIQARGHARPVHTPVSP